MYTVREWEENGWNRVLGRDLPIVVPDCRIRKFG